MFLSFCTLFATEPSYVHLVEKESCFVFPFEIKVSSQPLKQINPTPLTDKFENIKYFFESFLESKKKGNYSAYVDALQLDKNRCGRRKNSTNGTIAIQKDLMRILVLRINKGCKASLEYLLHYLSEPFTRSMVGLGDFDQPGLELLLKGMPNKDFSQTLQTPNLKDREEAYHYFLRHYGVSIERLKPRSCCCTK